MKKTRIYFISIIAILSLLMSNLWAQQTFRLYKHDGTMEVFFYSTLDSITFTQDGASAASLIQNFHTPDSVYQIPVNEIDSVAFNTIPTIYKNNITKIEGRLRDYVTGSDSLTLFVKNIIPDELLPACGDNVATLECDDVLPYGFIGKVENIVRGGDVIKIECSRASLLDIFDSLSLEVSATSDEENMPASKNTMDVWPPVHKTFNIPPLGRSKSFEKEIKAPGGLSATYDMTVFGEYLTQSCDVDFAFFITPMPFQTPHVHFSFSYKAQNSITIGSSLSSEVKLKKEFPLGSFRNVRIPQAPVFEIFGEAGAYFEIEGKLGLKGSYTKPFTTEISVNYDNKAESPTPPIFKMVGKDPIIENMLESSGAITIGLYGKLGIAPFQKEIAAITAGFKTGMTFSSSIDPSTGVAPIEIPNTEMYDELNRDDFYQGHMSLSGEITTEILGEEQCKRSVEIGDLLFRNPVYRSGVVPRFDEVSLTDEGEPGTLTATAKLNRKLASAVPVGFALYDDEMKFVDKWWADSEYKDNEGGTLTHKFEGLSANTDYTLHPITRAFNDNMVANPSVSSKIEVYVTTRDAMEVSGTSSTLRGEIVGITEKDNIDYGFYYGIEPTISPENGTYIKSSDISDGIFTAKLSNLQRETTYYYRACAIINGTVVLANGTKSFKISGNSKIVGKLEQIAVNKFENVSIRKYTDYEGLFKLSFENLGDLKIEVRGDCYTAIKNDGFELLKGEQYSSVPNDWVSFAYYSKDTGEYELGSEVKEFDCEHNSAIILMHYLSPYEKWRENTSSWIAKLPKPCGLKVHYTYWDEDEHCEKGDDIIIDFDVIYNQRPTISFSNKGDHIEFNITGSHWIRNAICSEYFWISDIESEEGMSLFGPYSYDFLLVDKGTTEYGYSYNSGNICNGIRPFVDGGFVTRGMDTPSRYVVSFALADGTYRNFELNITANINNYNGKIVIKSFNWAEI